MRRADQIIAVSESTKRDLIRMLGVPEDKITVIYEAADPLFQPVDALGALQHVQALFDMPEEFILFVSTIEPRKNVAGSAARLPAAARRLQADAGAGAGRRAGLAQRGRLQAGRELDLKPLLPLPGPRQHPRPAPSVQCRSLPGASGLLRGLWPDAAGGDGLRHAGRSCPTSPACRRSWAMPRCWSIPKNDEEITVALWRVLTDATLRDGTAGQGPAARRLHFLGQRAAEQTMDVYRKAAGR